MSKAGDKLKQQARSTPRAVTESVRAPVAEPKKKKPSIPRVRRNVVLLKPEDDWAEDVALTLRKTGLMGANRSVVHRVATRDLRETLKGMSPDQIVKYMLDNEAKANG